MPCLKLRVPGLTTVEDEQRIEGALQTLAGVYRAVARHEAHCVEIDFEDDEVTVERLLAVAADAGYPAAVAG